MLGLTSCILVDIYNECTVTSHTKCHMSHKPNPEWEKLLWSVSGSTTDAKHPKINYIWPHCLLLISCTYICIYKQWKIERQLRHDRTNSWQSTALTSPVNIVTELQGVCGAENKLSIHNFWNAKLRLKESVAGLYEVSWGLRLQGVYRHNQGIQFPRKHSAWNA